MTDPATEPAVFDRVGGMPFFAALATRFYEGVASDATLRALYPADLGPAEDHLKLFLAQYWGGPTAYSDARGHPHLRMRHAPFRIGDAERAAWISHMTSAVRMSGAEPADQEELLAYFAMAAQHLVNTPDETRAGPRGMQGHDLD